MIHKLKRLKELINYKLKKKKKMKIIYSDDVLKKRVSK